MAVQDTSARWQALLSEALDSHFQESKNKLPRVYTEYLTKPSAKVDGDRFISFNSTGLGNHVLTPELNRIAQDSFEPGNQRDTIFDTYGLAWRASFQMLDDVKSGRFIQQGVDVFKNINAQMARSWVNTIETLAAYMISSADSATATSSWVGAGRDGKALAATDHPYLKGGTFSNKQTGASLSNAQIEAALTSLATITDHSGYQRGMARGVKLVVGPYWFWRAKELVGTTGQPDTANNNTNPVKGMVEVVLNPYLSPTFKGYMFIAEGAMLHYFMRQEATFMADRDFNTRAYVYSSVGRFKIDHLSPFDTIFNPGP